MEIDQAKVLLQNQGEKKDTTPLEREALSLALRALAVFKPK